MVRLIIFEGLPGSGKSTQSKLVSNALEGPAMGPYHEPLFDKSTKAIIEPYFKDPKNHTDTSSMLITSLYAFQRRVLYDDLSYRLRLQCSSSVSVVTDRSFLSSMAHQSSRLSINDYRKPMHAEDILQYNLESLKGSPLFEDLNEISLVFFEPKADISMMRLLGRTEKPTPYTHSDLKVLEAAYWHSKDILLNATRTKSGSKESLLGVNFNFIQVPCDMNIEATTEHILSTL